MEAHPERMQNLDAFVHQLLLVLSEFMSIWTDFITKFPAMAGAYGSGQRKRRYDDEEEGGSSKQSTTTSCNACGHLYHSRRDCPYLMHHPDANRDETLPFNKSETWAKLQNPQRQRQYKWLSPMWAADGLRLASEVTEAILNHGKTRRAAEGTSSSAETAVNHAAQSSDEPQDDRRHHGSGKRHFYGRLHHGSGKRQFYKRHRK
jgi:hypothetical protein